MADDLCARLSSLDRADRETLDIAAREGRVLAEIYTRGAFNEAGFVLMGRLNALEGAGYMTQAGLSGAPDHGIGDAHYEFVLTERGRAAAPARLAETV